MVASDAYATCQRLAREHYENFPVASWLMPRAARLHIAAIYAFARIADDFADCTDGLEWYEVHKWAGCSLIYAVRAEGAMAWFIACNGGVPFRG